MIVVCGKLIKASCVMSLKQDVNWGSVEKLAQMAREKLIVHFRFYAGESFFHEPIFPGAGY